MLKSQTSRRIKIKHSRTYLGKWGRWSKSSQPNEAVSVWPAASLWYVWRPCVNCSALHMMTCARFGQQTITNTFLNRTVVVGIVCVHYYWKKRALSAPPASTVWLIPCRGGEEAEVAAALHTPLKRHGQMTSHHQPPRWLWAAKRGIWCSFIPSVCCRHPCRVRLFHPLNKPPYINHERFQNIFCVHDGRCFVAIMSLWFQKW